MTSRPVLPQQARGEVVAEGNKQIKKNVAGDGRNRRALGDIGNLVTVRVDSIKPQPEIYRPLTRRFCAQLLANAQAAAAADNKKTVCVNVDKAVPPALLNGAAVAKRAAAPKAAALKPKAQEVIEISPDTEQVKDNKKPEKEKEKNSTYSYCSPHC